MNNLMCMADNVAGRYDAIYIYIYFICDFGRLIELFRV